MNVQSHAPAEIVVAYDVYRFSNDRRDGALIFLREPG
jgi:hypothetical protein